MWNRRDALIRLGQVGVGSLALPGLLQAESSKSPTTKRTGHAKSCILVYLWGGPPQQDMWDLKPNAPTGIRSEFSPIATNVPGIEVCDQMPRFASIADKVAVVRSYTHSSNVHEVGVYHTLTGKENPSLGIPRNQRNRNDFPNPAAVLSYLQGPGKHGLPASVTVPRPIGHDGVTYTGTYAGFLGARHDPMELKAPGEVKEPAAHSLDLPQGLDAVRLHSRIGLLNVLEQKERQLQNESRRSPSTASLDGFREQAYQLLLSSQAKGAFNLDLEPAPVRERYGRNEYGEAFLMCRRLVEAGVRLVTLVWYYVCPDGNVANVWDNHGGTGSLGGATGYQMLKEKYCIPPLDLGYSALIEDLSQRGLLDETLVLMLGEFGRTPKINGTNGRDHWGPCQSVVLAGGGVRGGQVYGSSDAHAAYPKEHPVSPDDMIATLYYSMGIDTDQVIYDQLHRPHRITHGEPLTRLFG